MAFEPQHVVAVLFLLISPVGVAGGRRGVAGGLEPAAAAGKAPGWRRTVGQRR